MSELTPEEIEGERCSPVLRGPFGVRPHGQFWWVTADRGTTEGNGFRICALVSIGLPEGYARAIAARLNLVDQLRSENTELQTKIAVQEEEIERLRKVAEQAIMVIEDHIIGFDGGFGTCEDENVHPDVACDYTEEGKHLNENGEVEREKWVFVWAEGDHDDVYAPELAAYLRERELAANEEVRA